jgi:hypothetical protein
MCEVALLKLYNKFGVGYHILTKRRPTVENI